MNSFYLRLALNNLKRNYRTGLPYILSCVFTVQAFYIMEFLARNSALENMRSRVTLGILLRMGCIVMGIFSAVLLLYTNSFLIKRRYTELGLYSVLGMEKKHIARVLLWESLASAAVSLPCGIAFGTLFSVLMMRLLEYLMGYPAGFAFYFCTTSAAVTAVLFLLIFLLCLAKNLNSIRLARPAELFRMRREGQKEPRGRAALTVLGILCLGAGYALALAVTSPLKALLLFFIAVLLVIAGTYMLFISGSAVLLKGLKRNKKFYYQPRHFVAVSGLLYRMKQNAAGLASICILSTMVLVMLSSTLGLNIGFDASVRRRYPRDMEITVQHTGNAVPPSEQVWSAVQRVFAEKNLKIKNGVQYDYYDLTVNTAGGNKHMKVTVLTAQEYGRCTGAVPLLKENEALFTLCGTDNDNAHTLDMGGVSLVRTGSFEAPLPHSAAAAAVESEADRNGACALVVKDEAVLLSICRALYDDNEGECGVLPEKISYYGFDTDGSDMLQLRAWAALTNMLGAAEDGEIKDFGYSVTSAAESREKFRTVYGGLFFLGIFLGVLFIMATALIIYYKQLSENRENRQEYGTLLRVGMSAGELRGAVNSQVYITFSAPLLCAGVHMCFAFNIIYRMLCLLELSDRSLLLYCTVGAAAGFALVYAALYFMCARLALKGAGEKTAYREPER